MPSSTTVGTVGQIGERSGAAMQMPVRRPWLICAPVGSTTSTITGTWPAVTSRSASAEPL